MNDREWTQEEVIRHLRTIFISPVLNLASAMDIIQTAGFIADNCLGEELTEVFCEWERFTFDYYDMSFEVFGIPEGFVCSTEHIDRFRKLGFAHFWTHTADKPRLAGEKYYSCR